MPQRRDEDAVWRRAVSAACWGQEVTSPSKITASDLALIASLSLKLAVWRWGSLFGEILQPSVWAAARAFLHSLVFMNSNFHNESSRMERTASGWILILGLTWGVRSVPGDAALGSDFVLSAFTNCPRWRFDQHFLPIVQYANQVPPTESSLFTFCWMLHVLKAVWPCISHQVYSAYINTYLRRRCLLTVESCI